VSDFFAMGGYAGYVWPAFGFAAVMLLGLVLQSWRAARRSAAEFERLRDQLRPGRARRPQLRPVLREGPARPPRPPEVSPDASA
jgi:heme exporter protein D